MGPVRVDFTAYKAFRNSANAWARFQNVNWRVRIPHQNTQQLAIIYMHVSLSVYLRLHATRIINSFEVILFWNASNDLKRFARSDELLSPTVDTNYVLCIHSMLTLMYRISRLYITSFGLSLHPGAAGSRPMHGVLYVSSSLISITAIAVHSPSAARRCVPTKSTQFSEQ